MQMFPRREEALQEIRMYNPAITGSVPAHPKKSAHHT